MKKVIRFTLATVLLLSSTAVRAQEVETNVAADLVSQYIWRGQDLGNASLQPTLGVGVGDLSLTAWGSVGIASTSDTKELDLTLSYSHGGLTVGITDYWFNVGQDPRGRYFIYSAHETNHVFEAFAGYDFGVASLTWFTNIAGNDGVNSDGDRAYSTYVELGVPFQLATCQWNATAGVVPFATSLYGTRGFAVTNLSLRATKELQVSDTFSIPVFAQFTANPRSQKAYLVFGVTLQP